MSSFSTLKQKRDEKEGRYYSKPSSSIPLDVDGSASNPPIISAAPSMNGRGLYASIPPSLEIRTSEKGRGMYSKYARRPGDMLFSQKPHVAALSNDNLEEYCSSCFAPKTGSLRRCSGCKVVSYCDDKCQSKDWAFHRHECAAIQNSPSGSVPGDAIRCLGRILWRRQKLGNDSIWTQEIEALESHRASLSQQDPTSHESQMHAQLAHAIVRFLGLGSPQDLAEYGMHSAADLVDLVSRFITNTFTVSTPALAPLGACVSPAVALINHSCDPNAVVVFPRTGSKDHEPLMHVIALKHIAPDEEVLTAYIDTTLPQAKRQSILKETYHFTCQCILCAPPPDSPVDLREAMWCPKKCGGVCPLPTEEDSLTRCSRCKAPVKHTDAVLDAVRVGQEALDKAEALQFSNPEKAIQLTTRLVPILTSAGLVPASHPLLGLARLNASLLITHLPSAESNIEQVYSPATQSPQREESHPTTPHEAQEALDDAIRAATRASTGLSQILAEGHPVRGVALAELGKLLSVDEPAPTNLDASSLSRTLNGGLKAPPPYPPSGPPRLKLAYETLVRARSELVVGFGGGKNEGGEVGCTVRNLAVDLEKEMAVWKSGVKNALHDQVQASKR